MKSYTLNVLAKKIGAQVVFLSEKNTDENESITVSGLATLASAATGQIAFLSNSKYRQQLSDTRATAVIISEDCLADCPTNALVMKNPYLGYALVAQLLDDTPAPANDIHASAIIDETATLGANVCIGANAVIESGVNLADNVIIGAGCFIGKNVEIEADTTLWANVTVYHNVKIGQHCLVQSNTVLGSDGFGYAQHQGKWLNIPQLGSVIIGNHVEIGASTTIDRGALGNTIIHNGVILDNQIQIAHNVEIGENTAMAACSVIAGSTVVGKNCSISGLVGINGHINITDGCAFTGRAMVTKSITEPGVYSSGMPAVLNKEWNKSTARVRKLENMSKRMKALESEMNLLNKEQ
jgi:UDP-3-O-[3-hydroxymyristoyl] glucosamine N-acyltransferase